MKYIVNFSGGLCSFWAAWRTVQVHGSCDTVLLFADTLVESPELYTFNTQAAALLGVPITRVSKEQTPWQLFRAKKMIGNDRFPICSIYLKRELLNNWMAEHFEMNHCVSDAFKENATVIVGFDWTEEHRVREMRKTHPAWRIEAPMQEGEVWDKCRMQSEAVKLGLPISSAYRLGLPHDNCGGGCVRAGISHWAHIYKVRPHVFTQWEREERETAEYLTEQGVSPLSMLKDQRGGVVKNQYLWQLRERIETGDKLPKHDWGGCGCGGEIKIQPPTP